MLGQDDQAVKHAIDMEAVRTHLGDLPEREQRALNLRFYGNTTRPRSASASVSPRCTSPGCRPGPGRPARPADQ
jgi:hypothetical protein